MFKDSMNKALSVALALLAHFGPQETGMGDHRIRQAHRHVKANTKRWNGKDTPRVGQGGPTGFYRRVALGRKYIIKGCRP